MSCALTHICAFSASCFLTRACGVASLPCAVSVSLYLVKTKNKNLNLTLFPAYVCGCVSPQPAWLRAHSAIVSLSSPLTSVKPHSLSGKTETRTHAERERERGVGVSSPTQGSRFSFSPSAPWHLPSLCVRACVCTFRRLCLITSSAHAYTHIHKQK